MNCRDVKELVNAYADDELDLVSVRQVDEHLTACATCRGKLGAVRAVKESVSAIGYYKAPAELRTSILGAIEADAGEGDGRETRTVIALAPTRSGAVANSPRFSRGHSGKVGADYADRFRGVKQNRFNWWRLTSLAAAIVIVAGIFMMMRGPGDDRVVAEVMTAHLRSLQAGHLMDVVSTDQHTVKPWFDGKLDFAPPVKDLAAAKFPLLGGRLDYLDNRAVAALVYGRDKHLIDLYIWPDQASNTPATSVSNGYNAIHWTENGMSLWAVSDLEASQLQDFVRLWRAP